ncbi:acyl-CoA dehydrogenase [Kaustia mangrovi]|uniref:Acyl-coenzyme A dehydrogenase n=1 Tax=Kaustia mangrovi TaxID=2593653 RepID=A0A7S8C1A1_9HYPH|nr:acyl-CoA dehydrogenase [Kaustia mangrovi]QPC41452.1 acyl-CoA dehydrogenase [Kaustia mangrovi]
MTATESDGLTFRQRHVSAPVLKRIRAILPRMSDTEREALEAGTVWWDAELMSGDPDWERLLATPEHHLTDEEHAFLDGPVEELCGMIDDWEICFTRREIPETVWSFIKEKGFLGMIVPKEHGGLGFSAAAHSAVVMKLASRGASAAVSVIVPNSLGPGELLLQYGTEEQKAHYLPRLADGREIPAFGLTSVDAGSDAAAMEDRGVVCHGTWNGEKTLGMRLNWSKRYISLGPICTVLGLAFKLHDPDHLLGDEEDLGITVALVPADTPGVEIGRRHYPAMQVFPNGPNQGKDVFLPLDAIIGGPKRIGQGWRMLVSALAAGRGISLPSLSVSGMKLAARSTGAYARIREQFNNPVSRFEGVQEAIARIAGDTYRIDSGRRLTLSALDQGEKPAVLSGILKYHATEALRRAVDDAMDVHGGKAICDGPKNYLGNLYRAVPIGITVEGANILTRSLIIYGQGSIRCHPFILKEMMAAQEENPDKAIRDFDAAFFGHAGHILKTLGRAVARAWTGGLFSSSPVDGPTARHFKSVKRLSAALALVSEAAMLSLGGALKRKEMITGRLGDALSELYFASATLKRWQDDGRPSEDLPLVDWAVRSSLNRAEAALKGVLDNFPLRPLAWALRLAIRPFGSRFHPPSDRLAREVSGLVTAPSASRERLTAGISPGGMETELGRLEHAFREIVALDPARKAMREARIDDIDAAQEKGLISAEDAKRLTEARALVREVLAVDDFTLDEIKGLGKDRARRTRKARAA